MGAGLRQAGQRAGEGGGNRGVLTVIVLGPLYWVTMSAFKDREEILRSMYFQWGEYALAEGLDTVAWVEFCLGHPATRTSETDYQALEPRG